MTVLVVDDEPIDVEIARQALEHAGFQVLAANSYQSALEIADRDGGEIEIAVLDISLPGRNGVDLFQALLKRNASLKVLFVSGHVGAEIIRFYGLRATDRHFLKKPFEPSELVSRVLEVIGMREHFRIQDFDRSSSVQPAKEN